MKNKRSRSRGPRSAAPSGVDEAAPALRAAARRGLFRYLGLFLGFSVALFALYQLSETTHHFAHVNRANARLCSVLLRAIGVDNQHAATTVQMPGGGMEIISECSGIYVAILFAAGVLAFPTTWRARFRGLALGLPLIFLINLLRLVTLGVIIQTRVSLLPLFHEYLWQVFFVLVVAALYLLWIERFVPREGARQTA